MNAPNTPTSPPTDWHDAFAALPLETPPADGWSRIAATLAPAPRRSRRLRSWAIAAAAACLAALPALVLLRGPAPGGHGAGRVASTAPASATLPMPEAAPGPSASAVSSPPASSAAAAAPALASTSEARPGQVLPQPAPSLAPDTPPRVPAPHATTPRAVRDTAATSTHMDALYTESARLEALVAGLSDMQAGDGVQLALASSLRQQVAGIDEAIASGGLDEHTRNGLWQQRVDTLRQLAGIAADQRWNALYGDGGSAGYALVQVY